MQDTDAPASEYSKCCASFDERVRENPTRAILAALGVGIAAAIIVRSLRRPEQPRSHVKQLLEDIQERLHDLADPALNRLNELAGEGSAVLKKSAAHVNGIHQNLRSLGCRLKSLFQ